VRLSLVLDTPSLVKQRATASPSRLSGSKYADIGSGRFSLVMAVSQSLDDPRDSRQRSTGGAGSENSRRDVDVVAMLQAVATCRALTRRS